jgi:hypothetical protein
MVLGINLNMRIGFMFRKITAVYSIVIGISMISIWVLLLPVILGETV